MTAVGQQVQVSHRSPNGRFWQSTLVNVAFQVTLKSVESTTDFVVYALGDGVHGGAEGYARKARDDPVAGEHLSGSLRPRPRS